MLAGDEESTAQWLDAARSLILDFRSNKLFFPWDKYVKFMDTPKKLGERHSNQRPVKPLMKWKQWLGDCKVFRFTSWRSYPDRGSQRRLYR
jgi:hypothetical protein